MHSSRLAGIVGAVVFWLALASAGALTPGHSHVTQVVSTLGAIDAPFAWLINWIGIVPFASALVVTGWYILRDLRPGVAARSSGIALMVAGAGFLLAGVMPCDVGCRPSELLTMKLHNIGAAVGFLFTPLASLFLGLRVVSRADHRAVSLFSLAMALAMFASIALFLGVLDPQRTFDGLWQRLTVSFISVWVAGISGFLHRRSARG